jgi:ABC-type glycerol-3-phosphate transport system substrate-binding protein
MKEGEINMCKRKSAVFLLLIILMISISACGAKKDTSKERQLNIYADIKDISSQNILKFITDNYKKSNNKIKININNSIGGNIEEDIGKSSDNDIIITSRNNMLKLSRKGLLSDMSSYFEENKINEDYYRVVNAYGRFNDKYYGIALIPYTIEILYNKSAIAKMNIKEPHTINDTREALKKLNDMSIRVPVLLPEDLDINSGLSSIIFNNKVSMRKLESKYDSGAASYKSLTEVQQGFDVIADLIKNGNINKDTFEVGNESSINKFLKGDISLIICSSYYADNFKDNNIRVAGDISEDSSSKLNMPVICDSIICVPVNNKNGEEVSNFIKNTFSEGTQKKLVEKGFVTGNKKANNNIVGGVKATVVKHLENSSEDSIIFAYNIPEKLKNSVSSKIDQMLSGKITKKEWEEAVDEVYK